MAVEAVARRVRVCTPAILSGIRPRAAHPNHLAIVTSSIFSPLP